jgi:hypothetical protein
VRLPRPDTNQERPRLQMGGGRTAGLLLVFLGQGSQMPNGEISPPWDARTSDNFWNCPLMEGEWLRRRSKPVPTPDETQHGAVALRVALVPRK